MNNSYEMGSVGELHVTNQIVFFKKIDIGMLFT